MTDDPTPQVVYTLEVLENTQLSDNRFVLKTTKPVGFRYLPGQFVILKEQAQDMLIQRAYSVLAYPDEQNLAFYIKLVENGALTPILHAKEPGNSILMSGPYGHVTHKNIGVPQKLVLIAIGSGIAGIRPLAKYYMQYKDSVDLTVIHQARFRDNLIYFKELQQAGPGHYLPVLSKEKTSDTLFGHFQDYKDKWFDKDATFVLIGNRQQVEENFELLASWGADKTRMLTEKY